MADGEQFTSNLPPKVEPLNPISHWFMAIGLWGILLAVLNMFGKVHPTYHVSWGGLLTFEFTNKAFEPISDGVQITASDGVFLLICLALIYTAFKNINQSIGFSSWFRGLFFNETWKSLGGGNEIQRTIAAWCLLLGIIFYFWYGIQHAAWIDVGAYSVTIALVGFGFAMLYSLNSPEGDSKVD
jgi:hypothetical protein